jgi:hypothetical protein
MERLRFNPDRQTDAAVNLTKDQANSIAEQSKKPGTDSFAGIPVTAPLPSPDEAAKRHEAVYC